MSIYFYNNSGGSGGGTGNITIKDENNVIGTTSVLNFLGSDIMAKMVNGEAYIYSPPVSYASHWNTADGTTNAVVPDVSTENRYIANPGVYNIGDWSAGSLHPATNQGLLIYQAPEEVSFIDNNTTIEVRVYDADNTTVLAEHTETITGNIDTTQNNIRIYVYNWATDNDKFKANVRIEINISSILPDGGRFSVSITHYDGADGNFTKTQSDIFYDTNPLTGQLSGVTITENTPNIIQVSGVYYYGLNSTFQIDIADIDNINANSYPAVQVEVIGTDFGLPTLQLSGNELNNWTFDWDDIDDSYSKSDWAITQTNFYTMNNTAVVSARTKDWVDLAFVDSNSMSILVWTYQANEGRVFEDFVNENYRLQSDLNTVWDSTQNILTFDDGRGLQVAKGTYLIYPQDNYQGYAPNSSLQPDYSGASLERWYYRVFWHPNVSHSNGKFRILGVTEDDIANDKVIIWISLDGNEWYNCNEPYLGGVLNDGDGCRINADTVQMPYLEFTLGTGKFTDSSTGICSYNPGGYGIYLKIEMPSGSLVNMDLIEITNW